MKALQTVLKRPMSVLLIVIAIIVFGISSVFGMPMAYMPDMEMPMELVMITWPGTDADSIERLVTEPVETVCETMTDVNTVSSTTYDNYMMVQIQYNYSVDLDDAYSELKTAMDNLAGELPEGCNDAMIMEISMSASSTMSISALTDGSAASQSYLEETVVPALEGIQGVAQVEITGAQKEYMRIVVDEAKLQQYGLSLSSVGAAIAAADFDMPVGSVTIGTQNIPLSAAGNLDIATPSFPNIPIQTATGQLIRLFDVITFSNLYREDAQSVSRYNGQESTLLDITKQKSANTITVCRAVEDILEQYTSDTVSFKVVSSEADNIMDSLMEVVKTLVIGVFLTMLILALFFGNLRACLIVGCSMPLSVLLGIIVLSKVGFAFDLMSGSALVIAIGMIVDNSIVVLESCFRANERGLDFREAALQGTKEVMMSVFAGTLTTIVVYIPLALASGMSGQMAGPLSWTIALVMVSSLICAVTVVPLIFSLLKPKAKAELPVNRILNALRSFYGKVMPGLLRHPWRVLTAAILIFAFSIGLVTQMDFVLFPNDYNGSIQVTASFRAGTQLEVIDERIQELESTLLNDSGFEDVTLNISNDQAVFTAYAVKNATRSSEEAVEEYTERFGRIAGMSLVVEPTTTSSMSAMMGGGANTSEITMVADDMESLEVAASMVEEMMAQVPGVLYIDNEFNQSRAQGKLVIDAQKAMVAGTSQAAVAAQVAYMLNGITATTIDYGDTEYDVVLEYPENRYDDISVLMDHPIATATGGYVTLNDIAEIEYGMSLPTISRQDGQFITTVTATLTQNSGGAASAISENFSAMALPAGVEEGISASDKSSNDEISQMSTTLLTALFLVFLVMAIQFNSPRMSLMVMLCIPFSLAGSFGLVFLATGALSLIDLMGFLVLFGIVVNNGILLVDATTELRKTMPLEQALIQAGSTRLRPILMTTLTTVISMIPMLFSADSGLEMLKGMPLVVIGGLVASTILTMFLMPAFYLLIRGERVDGSKRRGGKKQENVSVAS